MADYCILVECWINELVHIEVTFFNYHVYVTWNYVCCNNVLGLSSSFEVLIGWMKWRFIPRMIFCPWMILIGYSELFKCKGNSGQVEVDPLKKNWRRSLSRNLILYVAGNHLLFTGRWKPDSVMFYSLIVRGWRLQATGNLLVFWQTTFNATLLFPSEYFIWIFHLSVSSECFNVSSKCDFAS